jgi:hypothetical protein
MTKKSPIRKTGWDFFSIGLVVSEQ